MDEKITLYMRISPLKENGKDQFYACTSEAFGMGAGNVQYYHPDAPNGLRSSHPKFYKSLKGLAVAIRKAGFHGVDKTK